VRPICTVAVAGVTAIELNVAAVTVKVAEPDLPPKVAVIVAVPTARPVATPGDTTVATARVPELHVTTLLMSTVVPSEYVPVATKVFVRPIGVEAVAGVTAIELNVAAVTVKVAEPDLPPDVAVIVATPTDTPVAMPGDTTVATGRLLEVHAAILLRSTVVPSVNVPVATKRCVRPIGIEAVNGVTLIELNVAFVTVKVPESDFPPKLAVMTDAPAATAVERPDALLTVATLVVPEVQMEDAVTSRDVPSL
jgi:hypothetical protein